MKFTIRILRTVILAFVLTSIFAGCQDKEPDALQQGYGYVQFRLYKDASYTKALNELDYLYDAAKVRVTLRSSSNDQLTPTVTVVAPDKNLAEWGVQTDKFRLTAGDYTLIGYQIFDALDNSILIGETDGPVKIHVVAGGLVAQDIPVNVVERGWVKFRLTKDVSEIQTKVMEDGAGKYPFYTIMSADVTVRNKVTGETRTVENLETTHEFIRSEEDRDYYTAVCKTDSLVSIKAGTYEIVGFRTYFDEGRKVYETANQVTAKEFVVKDNAVTDADVPVKLHVTSEYIQDAMAIKEIWEALDGPNWKVKWNFNSDVDLWTAQAGIQVLANGRVASLSLEGTGAKGAMPAAIGKLTELRDLYLGSHSFSPAASNSDFTTADLMRLGETDRDAFRKSFTEMFVRNTDRLSCFSEEMRLAFKLDNVPLKEADRPLRALPKENSPVNYATGITSLPKEINNLKKLMSLYIAYSPLTELPEDMSGMESLTDVEIYSCPDLTVFPKGLATLPKLQALTFVCNYNVTSESLYEGLKAIDAGNASQSIQIMYLHSQKLDRFPEMKNSERLSSLNIQGCGIKEFDAPFGKDHTFVELLASNNKLTSLPLDENGYFLGIDGNTEEINFSFNEFERLPDMFDAKSIYTMGTLDFSHNKIEDFDTFNGTYRGVNANTVNLSYNKLKKYPAGLSKSGSYITYLQLAGNGMEEVEEDALKGEKVYAMTSIDLSYNKLEELPKTFDCLTFPLLSGLDLSYNRFSAFPYNAVNNQNLHVLIMRHQRDADGNRCMKTWPAGIGGALFGLRALYLGSNDIRVVNDDISYLIYNLDISDNPNIVIDLSSICPYISAGLFNLMYSPDQDIRGCDILNLNR